MKRERRYDVPTMLAACVVLTLIIGLLLSLVNIAKRERMYLISTFTECIEGGYPILESYPRQCATPDGRVFTETLAQVRNDEYVKKPQVLDNGCVIAGCSGQLCVSSREKSSVVTTCEYKSEYGCYERATCEPQKNGKCGWTQTEELSQCIVNARLSENSNVN